MPRSAATLLLVILLASPLAAQPSPADTTVALGGVEVTATPFALESARAPLALTVRERPPVAMATEPAVSWDAIARGVPGLWVSDRENYALGERVLVRGVGWRSAFGVRGTHVLLDGVPLTLPDGQAMLNVVDPAAIRRVEVVRGPASVFWGSGSGGVLALDTQAGADDSRARLRALGGAYGLAKADLFVRPDLGRHVVTAWGSALTEDGFRDHSAVRLARAGASAALDLGAQRTLSIVGLGAWMPRAEAPGGLSAEAATADPTQTRDIAVEQDARKALTQTHLALGYKQPVAALPAGRLTASLYGGLRDLENPIIPRYIRLDRQAAGLRIAVEAGVADGWQAGLGVEGEVQRDDRLETSNDAGEVGADVLTDQLETVRSGAVFSRLAVPLSRLGLEPVTLTAAVRADALRYTADDRLGTGLGDGSGARTVAAVSPAIGLAVRWQTGPAAGLLYANVAGALDAPTTTELGNRPDGRSGFNPSLEPERTWGAEVGTRGGFALGGAEVGFDVAVFASRVERLLLPFEIDDVTFYRNAGRAQTVGLETALDIGVLEIGNGTVEAAAAYTWTRARFDAGAEAPSAEVPGFPEHLASWTVRWHRQHGFPLVLGLDGEAASGYFADDANTARTDAYAVVHARAALDRMLLGPRAAVSPFVEVRNVLGARYSGSVVVNAFGGRYFEPAAGRHLIVGVSLSLE